MVDRHIKDTWSVFKIMGEFVSELTLATVDTGSRAARTFMTRPSTARSRSPPRNGPPGGKKIPASSPLSNAVLTRFFCRYS